MIFLFAGFIIIAAIDLPPLIRKKRTRELWVFCILFSAVFILCILTQLGFVMPSSMIAIGDFMKNVLHLSY